MKFGIWTPLPHTVRDEPILAQAVAQSERYGNDTPTEASFDFALDTVLKAESYGFGITLIAERFLGPDFEAWMMAAALAARTSRIEIMPAIHPGIITPQVAAKMGATLDRLSGGRFAINMVTGWWKDEFNLFSNGGWQDDPSDQHHRMDEFVQVLRGLWSQEIFSFAGTYYHVDNGRVQPRPRRKPSPPIYAASRSDAGKDVIARHCDVWFAPCGPDHEQFEANVAAMARDIADMRQRAAAVGRTLQIGVSAHVASGDTMEQARAHAAELTAYGKRDRIAFIATNGLGVGLVGTPELLAERIGRLGDIGIDLLLLKFSPMREELDRFGTQVMPLVGAGAAREPIRQSA